MKMEINMKECSKSQRGMDKELINLLMGQFLKVSGKMEGYRVRELFNGKMEGNMMDSG